MNQAADDLRGHRLIAKVMSRKLSRQFKSPAIFRRRQQQ
jgi:hypothetical protein